MKRPIDFGQFKYYLQHIDWLIQYATRKKRLAKFLDISTNQVEIYFNELSYYWPQIDKKTQDYTGPVKARTGIERLQILYAIIRNNKPQIIVETGVEAGSSSFSILKAIKKNNIGKLYSIDLGVPIKNGSFEEIGWLVPQELRQNWKLIIGDSKEELPKLLNSLGKINIFLHDSLHTYEHMMFEFETAFPYLDKNKIILSDDIDDNRSFNEFVSKNHLKSKKFFGFGAARHLIISDHEFYYFNRF